MLIDCILTLCTILLRWWSELGLGTTLTFSRDNLIEHYLWNITMLFEPQYKAFRELTTKVTSMITLIDDVYDKLGSSLEELELLTHLIDRFGSLLLMFSLTFFFHRLQCVTSEWLI